MAKSKRDEYLGKVYVNNQGLKMTIVEYKNNKDVTVEFEDGATRNTQIASVVAGSLRHPSNKHKSKEDYLGNVYLNNKGFKMKVIEYNRKDSVVVRFNNGYEVRTTMQHVLAGNVKNVDCCSVYGIGYIGIGEHKPSINGVCTKEYVVWRLILRRCYDKENQKVHKTYKGCTVAREWHNFQNFAEWYKKEYYNIGEPLNVDKDFKNKGNTVYSPENCLLMPSRLNKIARHIKSEGYSHPIGVREENNRFLSSVQQMDKRIYVGTYDTPEQAFQAYKQAKEAYIQQVANEYKQKYGDKFPDKVYQALMNYRVEITD